MSPSPSPHVRDPLAEALFPVLVHRMNNATQILTTLGAVLDAGLEDALLEGSSEDLAGASHDVRELGWLLGVLASAGGANLLLERRERSGLDIVMRAVRDALRREGRDLAEAPAEDALPALVADVADGWQVPWAIASTLYVAGSATSPGTMLSWKIDTLDASWSLSCSWPQDTAPKEASVQESALATRIAAELPGARLDRSDQELRLRLPETALRSASVRQNGQNGQNG